MLSMRIRFLILLFFTLYTKRRREESMNLKDVEAASRCSIDLETTGLLAEVAANHALLSVILSNLADRLSWALVVLVA